MSYDPTESTPRDVIRGLAGDTADPFWIADETYDAVISKWGVPVSEWSSSPKFLRAGAEMLRRVAVALEQEVTSFGATGDMNVGWGDRTRSLRELASQLESQAADLEQDQVSAWGGRIRFKSRFQTGVEGGSEW